MKCEIVTPLLMHGANKNIAELRAPSIKGVMRFWWRAVHGNLSLDKLREQEAKIFGNTKQKSSFKIILNTQNLDVKDFNPLPHKDNNFKIKGFSPNQTFEIKFLGENLELVKNIFILSTILGGFGQRARRGFGCIKVKKIKDNNDELISFNYPLIGKDIEKFIKNKINDNFVLPSNNRHDFDAYPFIREIDIGNSYDTYEEVLKKIGLATHKYSEFGGRGNNRFASPLFVSIIKKDEKYAPIITVLNTTKSIPFKDINNFKKAIL